MCDRPQHDGGTEVGIGLVLFVLAMAWCGAMMGYCSRHNCEASTPAIEANHG